MKTGEERCVVKTKDVPDRLAAYDDAVARLFASLDHDAPSRAVQSSVLARIDAVAVGAARSVTPSRSALGRALAVFGVLVVTAVVGARAISREAPRVEPRAVNATSAAPAVASVGAGENGASDSKGARASAVALSVAVEDLPVASPRRAERSSDARPPSRPITPPGVAPSAPSASVESSANRADSFREQLALVERARRELSQSRAVDCIATLREYDAKFPSGVFTTEVKLVRVEALLARGQTESALALGRALLAADPDGPYAERLRSLLSRMDP